MRKYLIPAALIVIVASIFAAVMLFVMPQPAHATHVIPAPELEMNQASCYRQLVQTGDIFCLTRFELPTFETTTPPPGSPEAWCALLNNVAGCTDDPVEPTEPTSLIQNLAFTTMYDNCTPSCESADLVQQLLVPRIDHGLGGVYLTPGHGITFGDTDVSVCVESSRTHFTTFEQDCLPVSWNADDNTEEAQRRRFGIDLLIMMLALERDRLEPLNTFIRNNQITAEGTVFALEALSIADQITDVFVTSATPLFTSSFATPTGPLPLQTNIDATATAITGVYTGIGGLIANNNQREIGGLLIFVVLGLMAFFAAFKLTGGNDFVWPSIAFVSFMALGVPAGAIPLQWLAIFMVVLAMPAVVYVVRKMSG